MPGPTCLEASTITSLLLEYSGYANSITVLEARRATVCGAMDLSGGME
jgi:hypothetical protein